MRKLFLTSSGMDIREEIVKILPHKPSQLKLAHITTASKPEPNKDYVFADKREIMKLGIDVEDVDIEGKNAKQLRKILKDKDIIYVQGGNTFYLLKAAKESGFDKVVSDLIDDGKIYIGVSAGTSIAGPTIEQSTWKKHDDRNSVGLTDLTALNLIPFITVVHFEEKNKKIIEAGAHTTKYPIVALSDAQAVLVENDKWRVVGQGKREFLNGFEESV